MVFDANQDVRTFTYSLLDKIELVGPLEMDYTVTVKGVVGSVPATALEATSSYTFTLKNPCVDPAFVTIDKVPLPAGLSYALWDF